MPRTSKNSASLSDDGEENYQSSEDKKLLPYTKQLPTLTTENFVEFKNALENLQYYAGWDEKTLDLKLTIPAPWDGREEADKKVQSHRRLSYAVLRMKVASPLRHLLTGITPGDVRGLWRRIHNRFCIKTSGALQALKTEAENLSMQSTNTNVEKFSYLLQLKFKFVLEVAKEKWNTKTDQRMTNIFINGLLLPEFGIIVTTLQMMPVNQLNFEETYTKVF